MRVASISAGWPIAVLLLARFAHEGRLEPLLDKLDDVAYEELHEYLADQVLGDASPAVTDGLLASAGIPHASERDVRLALGDDAAFDAFLAFTKTSPFVTRGADGTFAVHPLVASTLLERHPARADTLLAPAAAAYESAAEYQRAAEIHLGRGDQQAAADALEHIEVIDEGPQIGYARVLASLDRDIVLRHSRLWSVTALARTFSVDSRLLHDEVESMWAKLPPDAPAMERIHLYVFRVLMLSYVGEYESALALVDEFRAQIAAPDVPQTRMHAWLLYLRSLMTARLGRTKEAEFDLEAAWPFINGMPLMAGGTLVTLGADVARVRGDRASERERIERAIEYARSTGFGNFVAFYEAEATFGAWFAGDDTDFVQHAFALEAVVEREGVRGFAYFTACARGHAAEPQPADQPKWIALGYLIAAANAGDPATALRYADVARETASSSRSPFYQVLAALAVAELNPARRSALRAEAAALAARIDAVELHEAIDALARGEHGGFLEPFVRRYRGDADAEAPRGGLLVELVTGRVVRDGQAIALAEREHALLTAVAMRAEALSRDRLTDLLWPDLGESAARNAFHVCLHRLKSRLGDDNVVVRTRDGYRLGSEVRVDLWEIDRGLGDAAHRWRARRAPSRGAARGVRPPARIAPAQVRRVGVVRADGAPSARAALRGGAGAREARARRAPHTRRARALPRDDRVRPVRRTRARDRDSRLPGERRPRRRAAPLPPVPRRAVGGAAVRALRRAREAGGRDELAAAVQELLPARRRDGEIAAERVVQLEDQHERRRDHRRDRARHDELRAQARQADEVTDADDDDGTDEQDRPLERRHAAVVVVEPVVARVVQRAEVLQRRGLRVAGTVSRG